MNEKKESLAVWSAITILFLLSAVNLFISLDKKGETPRQGNDEALILPEPMRPISGSPNFSVDNHDGFWQDSGIPLNGDEKQCVELYLELCRNTGADAVLVTRDRHVWGEWYSDRYSGNLTAMSSTKSITSLICGILIGQGSISLDSKVGDFLPEWGSGVRGEVTLSHLLSNTSGLKKVKEGGVGFEAEKNIFVRSLTPQQAPGTRWDYSNEGFQLISPLLEAAASVKLDEFALADLFIPLGMQHSSLRKSGVNDDVWTYADMNTTPGDLARVGYLVMNEGRFNETEIVSPDYLNKALTPGKLNGNYGLGWWVYTLESGEKVSMARGYLNTNLYIFHNSGWVIVRMQAPKDGYSGEDESEGYSEYSQGLFAALRGELSQQRINSLEQKVKSLGRDHQVSEQNDVVSTVTSSSDENIESLLQKAVLLSRNGNEDKVIALLTPLLKRPDITDKQQMQASLTLALQYQRKRNFPDMKKMLQLARESGVEKSDGFWNASYLSMMDKLPPD